MFKNLIKSTIIGVVNKAFVAIGFFLILPIMLEKLGAETFGIWITISSSASLISFLDLGIGGALINYVALNGHNKQSIITHIKLAYIIQLCFVATLIVIFSLIFKHINWGAIFNITPSADILNAIFITVVCFLCNLVTNSTYAIQRGLQKSTTANTWQLCSTILYLLGIWMALAFKPELKIIAIVSFGIPFIVSGINTMLFIFSEKQFRIKSTFYIKEILSFTRNSGMLLFLQIAALICFETDCLILAHYTSYNDVARFSITARLFSIPSVLLGVYLQVLWPAYSNALSQKNWLWIKKSFNHTLSFSIISTTIFIILAILFKDILLKYWLLNKIDISISLFIAFSFWTIVNNIDANIATLLNGLDKIKIQVYFAAAMVVSNLLLSILLVKRFGLTGVIWGSFIASLLLSVIPFYFYIKKMLKQNTSKNPTT